MVQSLGPQVSIGHIVPGGAADVDGRLRTGDEILSVDGQSVVHTSHHHVVNLMGAAALNGRVTIGVRRWIPAHPLHPSSVSPQGRYSFFPVRTYFSVSALEFYSSQIDLSLTVPIYPVGASSSKCQYSCVINSFIALQMGCTRVDWTPEAFTLTTLLL